MDIMENYKRWLGKVTEEDLLSELKAIDGKEKSTIVFTGIWSLEPVDFVV